MLNKGALLPARIGSFVVCKLQSLNPGAKQSHGVGTAMTRGWGRSLLGALGSWPLPCCCPCIFAGGTNQPFQAPGYQL